MIESVFFTKAMNYNISNCCSKKIRDRSPPSKFRKSQFTRLNTSLTEDPPISLSISNSSSLSTLSDDSEINEIIGTIDPSEVAEKLEGLENSSIIFDLRSASSFCRSHITTATLVSCSSKLKVRRAIQIVTDVIKTSSNLSEIIIYTEFGNPIKNDDHITSLIHFLLSYNIKCLYLKGGLKGFELSYAHFCESGSSASLCLQIPKSMSDISDIYFTKASQILPFLYLGNEFDAQNMHFLTSNKITHILNLTLAVVFIDEYLFKNKRIDCEDNHLQDLTQFFPEAFQFIETARQSNGRILVHCQAGISRSATVVIAYLMSHTTSKLDLNAAHQWVKKRRSIISPNFNFMGQLLQFETDLTNGIFKRCSVVNLDSFSTQL